MGMSRPKSPYAEIVERLAVEIAGGQHAAGSQLPTEPELGQRFGISRTVVREAIKTLAAKGLVTTGPRVGTRVARQDDWNLFDPDVIRWRTAGKLDDAFVTEVIELRLALEPSAGRLAAERATEADRTAITAAFAGMADAVKRGNEGYVAADMAFHTGIIRAAHNPFFGQLVPLVEAILRVSFSLSIKNALTTAQALPLHKAVLDAILERNGAAAEAALRQLIIEARHDIFGVTGELRQGAA
jgi:DNA-binding FadR family transcriptional regulator